MHALYQMQLYIVIGGSPYLECTKQVKYTIKN